MTFLQRYSAHRYGPMGDLDISNGGNAVFSEGMMVE